MTPRKLHPTPSPIVIDPSRLTPKDQRDFQVAIGVSIADALRPSKLLDADGDPILDDDGKPQYVLRPSPEAQAGMIWLAARRADPTMTLEEAFDIATGDVEYVKVDPQTPPANTPSIGRGRPSAASTA